LTQISKFNNVSLLDIQDKALMGRIDSKYIIDASHLDALLEAAIEEYDVLEIDGQRDMYYQTIYYDNEGFDLYNHARVKRPNRFKIRYRKYHVNNLEFFELKEKVRGTSTFKHRITLNENENPELEKSIFLSNYGKEYKDYKEVLDVRYNRICLISRSSTERITIDTSLTVDNFNGKKDFQNLAIIEVKSNKVLSKNPVTASLKKLDCHPISCSKYCIGLAYTDHNLKKSGFAPQMRIINTILR
jgi:hypothetical protein